MTRVDEAIACVEAGADLIGINFHAASPRFVDVPAARAIVSGLADPGRAVGVFVDRPAGEVAALAEAVGLRRIQLHGNEPVDDLRVLTRFWIIRAFRLGTIRDVDAMTAYLREARVLGRPPDAVLVDAHVPGQAGGTGTLVADDLLGRLPSLSHLILAGGLSPENVASRVASVQPWMVDVASGVESTPGRKDAMKVAAFLRAARNYPSRQHFEPGR